MELPHTATIIEEQTNALQDLSREGIVMSEQTQETPIRPYTSDNFDAISELRVAASTPPKELAASIIHLLNEGKPIKLAAIGHQAVGQAVKSIPVVNQFCIAQGYIVAILPSFSLMVVPNRDSTEENTERTVTVMKLIRCSPQ